MSIENNRDVEIRFEDLPVDDPRQRQPDISLAKAELGWSPTVALREGLKKTIAYFEGLQRDGVLDDL